VPRGAAGAALALLLGLLPAAPGLAQAAQDEQRQQAEQRLRAVLDEIGGLTAELDAARQEQQAEQARLRELDLAMQRASLDLRALEAQGREHRSQIEELERQRTEYLESLDARTAELAAQLRAAYRGGRQSRARLVLNLDDPAMLGRMLAYYDYVSRAQAGRVGELREALATLDTMQAGIDAGLQRLAAVQREQQGVMDELASQRDRRERLLARMGEDIERRRADLAELERDRADLEALIERLADVLADIPVDLEQRAGVAERKGRLPMPLTGPVRHAFGQPRAGGLKWQGWLIGAEPGAEVRAVAYGRVAFADWLRGYGLLLIIDHGQGYMSLYGHNESLLREAGAWVEAGDAISVVGSNPGPTQGLYFELRRNGKAVDPAGWLTRRSGP